MKFAKNVLGTSSTQVGTTFLSMLSGVITARVLAPADRGVLALVNTYTATIAIFCFFGINQANIYLVNREKKPVKAIASNALVYAVVIGLIACFLSYFFKSFILSTILRGVLPTYFIINIIIFPFFLTGTFMQSILRALGDFKVINIVTFFVRFSSLLGVIVILLALNFGLTAIIFFSVCMGILSCLIFVLTVKKRVDLKFSLNLQYVKSTFNYGIKTYTTSIVNHAHMRIDLYFLAYFLTTSQVAYYDISVLIGELLLFFPRSVGMVLFPKLTGLAENEVRGFTSQVCRITLFMSFFGGMLLLLSGRFLIEMVYGTTYLPAFLPMVLLLPGICNFCIYDILSKYFASRNQQKILIVSSVVALLINITFNLLLIPIYGITGAALATSLSYSLSALIVLYGYCKVTGETVKNVILINKNDILEIFGTIQRLVYSI